MKIKNVKFAKFEIVLEAMEMGNLPGYKGSMLRGALGNAIKKLCCCSHSKSCEHCIMESQCVYRFVFETRAPKGMKRFRDAPRPYIVEPPQGFTNTYNAGDFLTFNLVLIGKAVDYLPYFIMGSFNMAKQGLGKNRLRFRLSKVSSFTGFENDKMKIIYKPGSDLNEEFKVFNEKDIEERATQLSENGLTVKFITPLRMKQKGRHIKSLDFRSLIDDMQRRFSILSQIYWESRQDWDQAKLTESAETVEETHVKMKWFDWERYSNRQNRKMKFGGLIGETKFQGNLKTFLPLLVLGENLHVGGRTCFGLGRYEIVES